MRAVLLAFAALLTLPVIPASASCTMTTASGRTITVPGCTSSDTPTDQQKAPLLLYVRSIRPSALEGYVEIAGYITNQTDEDQTVATFHYKLWDRSTRRYVAVSLAVVDKTIPPHSKVSFETVIERKDLNGAALGNLNVVLVSFE